MFRLGLEELVSVVQVSSRGESFYRQDGLCRDFEVKEIWCVLGNEIVVELRLVSWLIWGEVREVGLGEYLEVFEGFN